MMRYIIPSFGRSDLQITLQSLPPKLLPHIELFVVPSEVKAYRKGWYASKVKSIQVWPEYVDCMPKKRKWLALNAGDDFMMLDDDLMLYTWTKDKRYAKAVDEEKLFTRRFTESLPALYDAGNAMVSCPMKYFADTYVKANGLYKNEDVGYVFTGFAKGKAKHVEFNKVFSFTDMSVPMQVLQQHKQAVTYYGMCFAQSSAKALATTGMSTYRTDFVKLDSALKMLQLFEGVVTGFRKTKVDNGGGISLEKRVSRLLTGVTDAHVAKSQASVAAVCKLYGLRKPPRIFQYPDDMPRDEIIHTFQRNWDKVKIKV
jgi:hypothetical protein